MGNCSGGWRPEVRRPWNSEAVITALETPVALFIYNRPHLTRKVFRAIAAARPRTLLIVAEGPRSDDPDDQAACLAARAETTHVDWPCEVFRDTAPVNIGCGRRLTTGLDWIFEQVPEAIVLEDDCLPHPSFFAFCAELLERYRSDPRVVMVGGHALPSGMPFIPYSYDFYRLGMTWGWATWRRAWQLNDTDMVALERVKREGTLARLFREPALQEHWEQIFTINPEWDARWLFACLLSGGVTVMPSRNLVSNIGFGPGATNATDPSSEYNAVPFEAVQFPLKHPPFVLPNPLIDDPLARRWFREPTLRAHIRDFALHRTRRLRTILRRRA